MFLIKTDAATAGVKSGFHCYILSLALCFSRENWNLIQDEELWVEAGFKASSFSFLRFTVFYEALCWCADICLWSMESTLHTHIRAEGFKFRWLLVGRTTDRPSGTNTSSVLVFFFVWFSLWAVAILCRINFAGAKLTELEAHRVRGRNRYRQDGSSPFLRRS